MEILNNFTKSKKETSAYKNIKDVISVKNLKVEFKLEDSTVKVIDDLDVSFKSNKIIGIIGESGSGKSVLGLSLLGILPNYAKVLGNFIINKKVIEYGSKCHRNLLGNFLGFISQNPEESLNPARKIKKQLYESLRVKYKDKRIIKEKAIDLLTSVGFKDTYKVLNSYPHELSGGMQQRALAAISIAVESKWIIADEPTKGLDSELCNNVSELFKLIKNKYLEGLIIITHDINFAQNTCDEVLVMHKGEIVEKTTNLLKNAKHPYTKDLIRAMPENDLIPILNINEDSKSGCLYYSKCKYKKEKCKNFKPRRFLVEDGFVECFLYE